ncbi:helix-turn-helix domain-containing protein [Candidatus Enterococcus clewellii]|uniref:HTH cro/C1-type domain-containing protein n=1 Tax=Candidatus Enterococcus clewellii TaxID=1834193 RepID=A0A242K9F8_9ENTE|nr:Rgg/GadR/MutR family transcriptional regulator [Enterococcus sp. 9E7_DIV0242]OTP17709.1 hypothetical protein A5888_001847 [Enterococcus sp. 9E7_DIV0242]
MNFGPMVRHIRLKKGFSQKEIYTGIISKSYAIEFEKGKHSISTALLIEVLDRLSMDMDEFLFINKGYLLNEYSDYIYRISKYANSHDLVSLKKLFAELSEKDNLIDNVHRAEVRCRIRIIEHFKKTGHFDTTRTLEEDRHCIQEYLLRVETWTLHEVQLFGNTIEFLDFNAHFPLFRSVSKSFSLYSEYDKGREIFCAMLINLINQAIKHEFLDYAEVLIQQLKLLSTDYKEFFHHAIAKYFSYILLIKRGDAVNGRAKAKELLTFFYELNQDALANELKVLLD